VELIGSHGQTVCHLPAEGVTLQVGEPAVIASRTRVTVVADFRPADLAAGGQGAPLVPYADWVLFRDSGRTRVLLNLGGIANVTVLPANCGLDQVRGWDTGPANMVMDYWTKVGLGWDMDEGGTRAATGKVLPQLLNQWLDHPYFRRIPPKTTGREEFGVDFAELARPFWDGSATGAADILATATLVTAKSVARSLREHGGLQDFEVFVSGGGAKNGHLMAALRTELPGRRVEDLRALGVEPEHKEALAFAILAHEAMNGVAGNVPSVTGARRAVVLGKIVRP
jgi:anhydro-N-acetylmuramic acid kinase